MENDKIRHRPIFIFFNSPLPILSFLFFLVVNMKRIHIFAPPAPIITTMLQYCYYYWILVVTCALLQWLSAKVMEIQYIFEITYFIRP